jgi:hypothetical protein
VKYKITMTKDAQRAFGVKVQNNKIVKDFSVLVPEVRKQFRLKGPKEIRKALLRDLNKGISPVQGQGKFAPYSESYKLFISGKKHFRNYGGKVVVLDGPDPMLGFASGTKRRSPVNLRFSGVLQAALKLFTTGGFTESFRLVFDWRDFLADIHNRRGAGKRKTVRRLLPTESGEQFNKEINDAVINQLNLAAKKVAKDFS